MCGVCGEWGEGNGLDREVRWGEGEVPWRCQYVYGSMSVSAKWMEISGVWGCKLDPVRRCSPENFTGTNFEIRGA